MTEPSAGRGHAIATPHHLATRIGAQILGSGGNAVDAAVAASIALAVVAPYDCGVGGDLFALIWNGTPRVYNGSGRAPATLTAERIRELVGEDRMPLFGPHTVTVPGAVRGWFDLLERHGTRAFDELAAPAIELAEEGFDLTGRAVGAISRAGEQSRGSKAWRAIYEPALRQRFLVQPGLGALFRRVGIQGPSSFYEEEVAAAISGAVEAEGGSLTPEDLAVHHGEWVGPVACEFYGYSVHEAPPNSQGVVALQALAALDDRPLESMGELKRHLLLIDAARLAVGERDRLIADPDHMRVGAADLLDEQWVGTYRRGLEGSRGLLPSTSQPDLGQTAYLCCADEDGLLISLIQSNFLGFGAGITVPRFGINLHNRGAGFSLAPGHPNEAAGRKRPLHTLMPALITRNGEPTHLVGTMGGTNQIAIQLQLLTRLLVDGVGPSEAVAGPRWALGDARVVLMESELAPSLGPAVTERGGRVEVADGEAGAVGYAQALRVIDGVVGAADPRSEGSASAVP